MMELSGTTVYDKKTLRAFSFFALCPIKKAGRWNILLFVFSFAMGIIGFYLENTLEARLSAFLSNRLFVLSALFVIYPVMIVIFLLAVTWKKKQPFTIHFVFRDEAFHVEFSAKTVPALSILTIPRLSNAMNSKSFFICMLRKIRSISFKRMLSMRKMARFCCVRS